MPTIRQAAAAEGMSRYFTGKPCKNGHLSDRHVVNGKCCECHRIGQRKQNEKYDRSAPRSGPTTRGQTGRTSKTVVEIQARALAYAKANPEQVKEASRKFYERYRVEVNRRSSSGRHLREKGITLEQYETLMASHNGQCDICKTTEPGGQHNQFNLDHCHTTGVLRGVLCRRCNTSIGQFEDSIPLLLAAVDYLRAPPRASQFANLLSEGVSE